MSRLTHGHHNAMWVRIVNVIVMPIKRCFDSQRSDTKHKQPTQTSDPKYVVTEVSRMTDYREFYLHWSIHSIWYVITWIVHCANDTEDRLRPDVFICDSLSPDQNRQSQTRSIMDHRTPSWCHRCHNHPTQSIFMDCSQSAVSCFYLIELEDFIFCHVLISTLWWKW